MTVSECADANKRRDMSFTDDEGLTKRQGSSCKDSDAVCACDKQCATTAHCLPAAASPIKSTDCDKVISSLNAISGSFIVKPRQIFTMSSGTCAYRVTGTSQQKSLEYCYKDFSSVAKSQLLSACKGHPGVCGGGGDTSITSSTFFVNQAYVPPV